MKTFLFATALAGTMLSTGATAQTPPTQIGGGRGMMRADTDGDGRISRTEALAQADERFTRMDANNDGKLCGDEMPHRRMPPPPADGSAPPPPMGGKHMMKHDTDGDGCRSRDEFRAQAMKRFDKLDTNHDGFIDQSEMSAMRDRMMQMRERRHGGSADGAAADMPPPPAPPQDPGQ